MNKQQSCEAKQNVWIYSTVRQFIERHPAFTLGGIRSWIFNEHHNGLSKSGAIIRIDRKVLIDEPKFFQWIQHQNGGEK